VKPLELTVYPLRDKVGRLAERGYIVNKRPVTAWYVDNYQIFEKRLTDVELAAEYWRLRLKVCASGNRDMKAKGHVCTEWQAAHDELDTMQRFMDLPHYDEDQP
jgi:hypothetical protein